MNKKILKDKKGKTVICAIGQDRKALDPIAEAFMNFCEQVWGMEFVDVTPKKGKK